LIWIVASIVLVLVVVIAAAAAVVQRGADRIALRAVRRSHSRIDRFKLTKKPFIRQTLLADCPRRSSRPSRRSPRYWRRTRTRISRSLKRWPFRKSSETYKLNPGLKPEGPG